MQLRTTIEDPQRPHALRIVLQDMDIRAGRIHRKSDPPNAGIEQLGTSEPADTGQDRHLRRTGEELSWERDPSDRCAVDILPSQPVMLLCKEKSADD